MTAGERVALIQHKVDRAKRHLSELQAVRDAFLQRKPPPYLIDRKPDSRAGYERFDVYFMSKIDPVPDEVCLVFGDVIHNLRASLDHLACQLVEVAGRSASDQTAFPIFKSTRIDESSFSRRVNGMSDAAKEKIRSMQPYKNGEGHYLWVLHKLDIADKHHKILTTLMRVSNIRINIPGRFSLGGPATFVDLPLPAFAAPGFGEALQTNKPFFTCERGTEDVTEIDFDVAISEPEVSEPKPVIWAANYLIENVERLIKEFKPLLD